MNDSDLNAKLERVVIGASKIRNEAQYPPIDADVTLLHAAMVHNRAIRDRMEAIYLDALVLRSSARLRMAARKDDENDAWAKAALGTSSFKFAGGWSDPAPRERYAYYGAQTTAETMALREAEKLAELAETTFEAVRTMLFGLDGLRRELETRVRMLSFAGSLES